MTKKAKIITISIVLSLLALIAILFGAVFCLYRQDVVFVGVRSNTINITDEDIIKSADLKRGRPIFSLDKETASNNIERDYPYLKVIQISTVSVIEVEINVRERYEMYYTYSDSTKKYYILDEELKVLNIVDDEPTGMTKIEGTILGEDGTDILGITSNTVISDFLSTENYRDITYNLFISMCSTVMIDDSGTDRYVERDDIKSMVDSLQFAKGYTLQETYDRVILNLSNGFVIDIGKPQDELQDKVNVCFKAMESFIEEGETGGTIKVTYLDNGEEKIHFIRNKS